jgi:hypothetical protein
MSGAMHDICHAWHNAGISRSGYQRAFGHAGHFFVRGSVTPSSPLRSKEHELGRFLEIGSMSWQWCIEPFGIEPRSNPARPQTGRRNDLLRAACS